MNLKLVQCVFWAWCILLSGCTVCQNARRTMCHEPSEYSGKHDRQRSVKAYRQVAEEVWQQEAFACPDLFGQPDYALGFRDGFVDYVYAGGSGEPPPVPPRHFWNVALRAPDGKERANQWFNGYRHGARVAREGGYRDLGIVHSSVFGLEGFPDAEFLPGAMGPIEAETDAFWPDADFDPQAEALPEPDDVLVLPTPTRPAETPSDRLAVPESKSAADAGPKETAVEQQQESPTDEPQETTGEPQDQSAPQELTLPAQPMFDEESQSEPPSDETPDSGPFGDELESLDQSENTGDLENTETGDNIEPANTGVPANNDATPKNNGATREAVSPIPPVVATDRRDPPAVHSARAVPPVRVAPSPAIAPARASQRTPMHPSKSTLRFVESQTGAAASQLPARPPATLLQTSFVVKAPVSVAPYAAPQSASADAASKHNPRGSSAPLNPPAHSTIKIRGDASAAPTRSPSNSKSGGPVFIR